MKKLLLAICLLLAHDALGGYSAPSRGGFSAPSRSYSAPSRSYSAPSRAPTYTAPARTPVYTAPAKSPVYTPPAPRLAPAPAYSQQSSHTTIINQAPAQSGGLRWYHYLMFWQLMRNNQADVQGMNCHGGGCTQRVCEPVAPPP